MRELIDAELELTKPSVILNALISAKKPWVFDYVLSREEFAGLENAIIPIKKKSPLDIIMALKAPCQLMRVSLKHGAILTNAHLDKIANQTVYLGVLNPELKEIFNQEIELVKKAINGHSLDVNEQNKLNLLKSITNITDNNLLLEDRVKLLARFEFLSKLPEHKYQRKPARGAAGAAVARAVGAPTYTDSDDDLSVEIDSALHANVDKRDKCSSGLAIAIRKLKNNDDEQLRELIDAELELTKPSVILNALISAKKPWVFDYVLSRQEFAGLENAIISIKKKSPLDIIMALKAPWQLMRVSLKHGAILTNAHLDEIANQTVYLGVLNPELKEIFNQEIELVKKAINGHSLDVNEQNKLNLLKSITNITDNNLLLEDRVKLLARFEFLSKQPEHRYQRKPARGAAVARAVGAPTYISDDDDSNVEIEEVISVESPGKRLAIEAVGVDGDVSDVPTSSAVSRLPAADPVSRLSTFADVKSSTVSGYDSDSDTEQRMRESWEERLKDRGQKRGR